MTKNYYSNDQNATLIINNCTCYSKYCDQAVCQGQVHEQGGGPLLPHPPLRQGADGKDVPYRGQDH